MSAIDKLVSNIRTANGMPPSPKEISGERRLASSAEWQTPLSSWVFDYRTASAAQIGTLINLGLQVNMVKRRMYFGIKTGGVAQCHIQFKRNQDVVLDFPFNLTPTGTLFAAWPDGGVLASSGGAGAGNTENSLTLFTAATSIMITPWHVKVAADNLSFIIENSAAGVAPAIFLGCYSEIP